MSPARRVVLGMSLMLVTEVMFFTALISAYLVARANVPLWPPLDQPRLPVLGTAFNSLFLLASGVTMLVALRRSSAGWTRLTAVLGLAFVTLQGAEWVRLLGYGLTTSSSLYGAFFYTLVGTHALHVLMGLVLLIAAASVLRAGRPCSSLLIATTIYWSFVVLLWPCLYALVYLV